MRRSLAALGCGLVLAVTVGCGGGGGSPQSSTPDNKEPTASIPGPGSLPPGTPAPMPTGPAFLPGDVLPAIEDDTPRMKRAREQIDKVTQAVHQYISKTKAAPPKLEMLAQPADSSAPYFDPVYLIDPWGSRIMYDATGVRNGHKQPDIWYVAADGSIIGNWSDKPIPAPAPPAVPPPTGANPEPLFPALPPAPTFPASTGTPMPPMQPVLPMAPTVPVLPPPPMN